ncbi:hypothetical protein LguiA_025155 [Lonicera macranthoides]
MENKIKEDIYSNYVYKFCSASVSNFILFIQENKVLNSLTSFLKWNENGTQDYL